MKNFHGFPILFSAILLLALQSKNSPAQSQCCGRKFGIPICTGFCIDIDTSSVHKRINKLERNADSLRKEAAKLSDSLRHQSMQTFENFGEEFQKQWEPNVPHELRLPFDGSLHLPPNPVVPQFDLDPFLHNSPFYYYPPNNNLPLPFEIDPTPPDEFFEPGVPHSPFYYIPPNTIERMPKDIHGRTNPLKIKPFRDEKKNPIPDFKGWYYEKVADISK